MVDVHHLGQEHLHAGPCRLPAPVRADPLRMARGLAAPLVRRPRPRRRLEHQKTTEERPASDDEAGGVGRARDSQFESPRQRGPRPLRRLRHDADCGREVWAAGAADRTRSEVRRCDRAPLAGLDRQAGHPRGRWRGVRSGGKRLVDDFAVNHEPSQVRQTARDAVVLAGLASDLPAHPLLCGGVDRIRQGQTTKQSVLHLVGEVATMAAVEEDPHRVQRLAGGVRDGVHRQGPRGVGVFVHRSPIAPGFVLGDGDRGAGHLGLLRVDVATSVVTRCSIEKPSTAWPLSRSL